MAAIRSCDGGIQGPENLILMLAERLRGTRYDHIIVNLWDGKPPRVALHDEALRRGLTSELVTTTWDFDPSLVPKLRRLLKEHNVDLIHTYGPKAEVASLLATVGLRIPLVGSYFGCFPMWPLHVQLAEATSLLNLRLFRLVLANSESLRKELLRFQFRARRIHVIPSYVDTDQVTPPTAEQRRAAREALGLRQNAAVLIQLARLHWEKGHGYLLKSLPRILQAHPEVIYIAVGEGWMLDELQRSAKALGVSSSVVFTGYYPDRLEALRAADVMIVPSVREGMSVSLLEGMAVGLPIVGTRVYGTAEVLSDAETGFLVEPRDPEALADATIRLLDDVPKARAMGAAARRVMKARFSADRVGADIVECYDRVLHAA